jgi:hypothetical protein
MLWLRGEHRPGVYFAPNNGAGSGGGGTGSTTPPAGSGTGTNTDPNNSGGGTGDNNTDNNDDDDAEPEGLTDAHKKWVEKQRAKAAEEAKSTVDVEKAKQEAVDAYKREQQAAARRAKQDQAAKDGDKDAQIAAITEERDTLRTDNERLSRELANSQTDVLKAKIATEFKLPPEMAKRLVGSNEAELRADAKDLSKSVKTTTPPPPNMEGGNRGSASPEDQRKSAQRSVAPAVNMF